MTRILTVPWPDARLFARRNGAPVRLLAVSDEVDPALEHAANRDAIGRLDAIVGCGDLEPSYLCFLADAFGVPVAYVRGNHDRGGLWADPSFDAPRHLASGSVVDVDGITVAALEWPGLQERQTRRDESRAWRDVIHVSCVLGLRGLRGRQRSGPRPQPCPAARCRRSRVRPVPRGVQRVSLAAGTPPSAALAARPHDPGERPGLARGAGHVDRGQRHGFGARGAGPAAGLTADEIEPEGDAVRPGSASPRRVASRP